MGFGGVLSAPSQPDQVFRATFSLEEAASSSTLRKVLSYVGAVQTAAEAWINFALCKLFNISTRLHCDVLAQWVPREEIQEADAFSREPDASDWGLHPVLFGQICKRFDCQPSIDIFASDAHHVVGSFISKEFTPGCTGTDAFRLDWGVLAKGGVAWVFPPNNSASVALSMIERFAVNACIVMPTSAASNEFIQLHQLPAASVFGPFTIPRAPDSLVRSLRVPGNTLNLAVLGLGAFKILW